MRFRVIAVCMELLSIGACSGFGPADSPSIAGQYTLVAVDGSPLPCCGQADSTGARVTVLAGTLTLAESPPERFAATPAGYVPLACIHEVPNGAHVDTGGVVTLPDSSKYRIPKCVEIHHAAYKMTITRRYDSASAGSRTVSDSSTGVYAWSASGPALVSLLGSGLIGEITTSRSSVDLEIHPANIGMPPEWPGSGPRYEFAHATR